MTPDRLMYSPSKKVFVFTANGHPVQVGAPHYRTKSDAVRAALKRGLLVDFAGRVTQVDDDERAAYEAAHAKLEDTRELEGMATLRTKVGTRVRFTPNAASHPLYSNPPEVGEEGEVTTVPMPGGRRSSLKGPGGGLLYVKWDNLGTMGVSPRDVEVVTGMRLGKGKKGQRIETDDVVIETTLHPIEFEGPVRSLTYGVLPKFEEFRASTKDHYPYPMELVGDDESVMRNVLAMNSREFEAVERFSAPHGKFGVRVKSPEIMYRLLTALNDLDDDAASDLASAILGTLGYEWV